MEDEIMKNFLSINEQNCSPTTGKYSSKKETFYEDIKKWQGERADKEHIIKPIQFTFEITNRCNCNCKDCGMSANSIKVGKTKIAEEELYKIIDDLYEQGIPAFAITGGEPFLEFDNMCKMIKYSKNNIDSLQYNQFLEEQNPNSIKSRIGNLTDLNLKVIDNQQEISMQGIGMFSQTGIFKELYYTSDSILSTTDNSTKMVSTEWIHRLLPQGSIIMFNGTTQSIPNGWKICDGTENTPNLTNYFVRADTNSGNTQTYEVVLNDQLQSNQNILQLQTYSLIFIMKMI